MAVRPGIFVDDNTGVGVTGVKDARLALSGLVPTPGLVTGMVVSGSSSGPNMKYVVSAGVVATARGVVQSDGIYLWANDGNVTIDSGRPAPSSGSRYDLVWALHSNAFSSDGFGDANSLPSFGVTVGTAGATPVTPYASVPPGALVLAECLVSANAANAAAASVSQVASGAGPLGISTVSDWNQATLSGIYQVAGTSANGPTAPDGSTLTRYMMALVLTYHTGQIVQVGWRVTSSTTGFEQWQRIYTGTAWGPWAQVAGDPPWNALSGFASGVTKAANKFDPGYALTGGSKVELRGGFALPANFPPSGATLIAKLPAVMIPLKQVDVTPATSFSSANHPARLTITTDGVMQLFVSTSDTLSFVSLDGLFYYTS